MIIMAVDPGPHIGLAVRYDDGRVETKMLHNELDNFMSIVLMIKPHEIVVERFATGGRMSGYGHETVEIVGVCCGLAYALGSRFEKRTPQQRYAFMEEARTTLNAGRSKIESHEVDALAHLLSWEYWRNAPK